MAQRYDRWLLDRLQSDDEDELAIAIVQNAIADVLAEQNQNPGPDLSKRRKIFIETEPLPTSKSFGIIFCLELLMKTFSDVGTG
jgi:hypothetical protein